MNWLKRRIQPYPLLRRTLKTSILTLNKEILSRLEKRALTHPLDISVQNQFYNQLNNYRYYDIIKQRYESHAFASNDETISYYKQALMKLNLPEEEIDEKLKNQNSYKEFNWKSGSNKGKVEPIKVIIEDSKSFALWKILRSVGLTLLNSYIIFSIFKISIDSGPTGQGSSIKDLMSITEGKNNLINEEDITTTFDDVQGLEEVKYELQDLVKFLKNPDIYNKMGAKLPKGILLTGPPGTGKTLLARAIAGESKVPFFLMSGSEFDEVYVGVGAKRVRDLFQQAKKKAPCIVFIDELDAVGSKRNPKDPSLVKQTLNQLLTELDGFSQNEGIIIIGATNHPDLLDSALLRPGRFDLKIEVPLPDIKGRLAILKLYSSKVNLSSTIDLVPIAKGTPGFSGAELANLINIAAVQATREEKTTVEASHLEFAKDRIIMGTERKSMLITEDSKLMTAYHEAGHALVAYFTAGARPLHKVTIIPRGNSLGMTVQLSEDEEHSFSRLQYKAMIDVCMGGRVAEELIYGHELVSSGASSDIQQATRIAHQMVTRLGLSESAFNDKQLGLLDYEYLRETISSDTKLVIDKEVKRLIDDAYLRASKLLESHKGLLHRMAKKLVQVETLNRVEIDQLLLLK